MAEFLILYLDYHHFCIACFFLKSKRDRSTENISHIFLESSQALSQRDSERDRQRAQRGHQRASQRAFQRVSKRVPESHSETLTEIFKERSRQLAEHVRASRELRHQTPEHEMLTYDEMLLKCMKSIKLGRVEAQH